MAEMNKEVLMVVESVSHEKGVSKDVIFEAIEQALATATQKKYRENARFAVSIDRESGHGSSSIEHYKKDLLAEFSFFFLELDATPKTK